MRRQRTSHRDFDTNRGIPIYDDVVRGSGGLYLFTNDTVDPSNIENTGTAQAGFGLHLSLPGTAGNYASTPDSAAVSITGDIDIRAKLAMDDWTPSDHTIIFSKYGTGNISWDLLIRPSGFIAANASSNGSAENLTADSTAAPGFTDGSVHWLRYTRISSSGVVRFYTSDDGLSWSQLGADVSTTAAGLFDSTAPIEIGTREGGTQYNLNGRSSKIYYAEIRNGIDGTVVAVFDVDEATLGAASVVSSATGEMWTIHGTAAIKSAIKLASTASATNDAYNGMSLQITSGTGSGQDHQRISDYDGTTKEATVSGAWTTTPDSTSVYRVVNRGA